MKTLSHKLSQREYTWFRELILEKTGIYFGPKKRAELQAKLLTAFAKSPSPSLEDYYQFLRHNPKSAPQMEQLINSLTVGETHFFRNAAQFEALKEHILPKIIASKRDSLHQIRIWSAGCATGEEPYSVAILVKELLPDIADWNVVIIGTDINLEYLARAQAGVYGEWSFRNAPVEIESRYFSRHNGKHRIFGNIKQMVHFAPLNLIQDNYPCLTNNIFAMDLILCRNVTIYFHPDFVKQVVKKFYQTLLHNGWLIVGHSEPSMETYQSFQTLNFPGTVVYKKVNKQLAESLAELNILPLAASTVSLAPSTNYLLDKKILPATSPKSIKKPTPSSHQKDAYKEGIQLFNTGKQKQALAKFRKKLSINAGFIDAYYMIAKIYANRGQLDTAITWCQQALKVNKLTPRIYYLLGLILMQKNLYEEAKEAFRKLLYLDQGFIMGYLTLAQIHRKENHEYLAQRCLDNLRTLLQAIPDDEVIPEAEGRTAKSLLQILDDDFTWSEQA